MKQETTEVKAEEQTNAPSTSTKQAESAPPELTVADLSAVKSIIDVASSRGAFKPNEMVAVGQVYSKLETFLAAVQAQQQAQTSGE